MKQKPAESSGGNGPSQTEPSTQPAVSDTAGAGPPYVIDTSVAVKWYIPEVHSIEAKGYLKSGLDRHAPDYLPAEAASVVLKRIRSRDVKLRLTRDEGRMVLAAVAVSPIQFHHSQPLIEPAFALAEEVGASLYDGLFLALALQLQGQLVTADKKLLKKIQQSRHSAFARWVEAAP
jgi:predicted nucleic acid-binding protein